MTGGHVLTTPRKGKRTHTNVTVDGTARQLCIDRAGRSSITFQNQGSVDCFIAKSDVAASGGSVGYKLAAGATIGDMASDEAWWGITGGTSINVHVIDV